MNDKRLARIVRRCQELPGQALFQYLGDDGRRSPVGSGEVNDYLRETMGGEFTAKDFRTWAATTKAVVLLSRSRDASGRSERACKDVISRVVEQVAQELHNTPAVCRKSYINPAVFEAWRSGHLRQVVAGDLTKLSSGRAERKVLQFLRRLK